MTPLSIKEKYHELIEYFKKYYLMTEDEAIKVIGATLNKNNAEDQKDTNTKNNFSIFKIVKNYN